MPCTVYHGLLVGTQIDVVLGRLSSRSPTQGCIDTDILGAGSRIGLSGTDRDVRESYLAQTTLRHQPSPVAVGSNLDIFCCCTTEVNGGIGGGGF